MPSSVFAASVFIFFLTFLQTATGTFGSVHSEADVDEELEALRLERDALVKEEKRLEREREKAALKIEIEEIRRRVKSLQDSAMLENVQSGKQEDKKGTSKGNLEDKFIWLKDKCIWMKDRLYDIKDRLYDIKDWSACKASCVTIVGVGGVAALPLLGFTTSGVAAGSWAAYWMSFYAGSVKAGSLFAFLQSLGAKGLSWKAAGGVFGVCGTICSYIVD